MHHPWELARYAFFSRQLRRHGLLSSAKEWLDVGSGDAWFASELTKELPSDAKVTCWDANYTAATEPKGRDARMRFSKDRPEVRANAILLLDVLEHVEDDHGFLGSIVKENAAPGAHVLVSVPAWQSLFAGKDVFLRHYRRYSPERGRKLVEGAGLQILEQGGLFHSLLPARALAVGLERLPLPRRAKKEEEHVPDWQGGPLVTRFLTSVLSAEGKLSESLAKSGISVPGLSWWALLRAPG